MVKTIVAPHGLFYMENAGGYKPAQSEKFFHYWKRKRHQPSCFAAEEERGAGWKGNGAMGPAINDARPSL